MFHTIGILSIGEMGLGIAQLLLTRNYRVVTFAADRSEATQLRARSAGIDLTASLEEFVNESDCILSIVPPRDAYITAKRILDACARESVLYYIDLNAVSPKSATTTASLFENHPSIIFIDGAVSGGVPHPLPNSKEDEWHCPTLLISGPSTLPDPTFSSVLNFKHISDKIGTATGLKMCFGATTKGFTALAIQSFTTAHELGVLDELRELLGKYAPATLQLAEKGVTGMPSKAYRWVHEMREIGDTFEGVGFESDLLYGVAKVYQTVADNEILGKEQPGKRVRGKTVEDVVELLSGDLKAKI